MHECKKKDQFSQIFLKNNCGEAHEHKAEIQVLNLVHSLHYEEGKEVVIFLYYKNLVIVAQKKESIPVGFYCCHNRHNVYDTFVLLLR